MGGRRTGCKACLSTCGFQDITSVFSSSVSSSLEEDSFYTHSLCNLWFFVIPYKVVIPGVISPVIPHCLRSWAYFHNVKSTVPGSRKVPRKSEGPPTLSYKRKYLVAKVHALSRQGCGPFSVQSSDA